MNKRALILAGFGIFCLAAAIPQGVLLRRDVKENTTEVYKLVNDIKQTLTIPSMGDQDANSSSSMTLTLKTTKVDPTSGQGDVESTISDIKMKSDGMGANAVDQIQASMPKEFKTTGKIDPRNHMVLAPAKGSGMLDAILGSSSPTSSLIFVEFPDKAVSVGDSWTFELPKSPFFGKAPQTLTAKLVGEKSYEGAQVWQISVSGIIKIDADLTEVMKNAPDNPLGGQKATMKGTIDLTGDALIDKQSGKTLAYSTSSKTKGAMELPDMGITIDSVGSAKTTMTLQK
ncbi:MAG: hypothetical protein ACHQ50_08565 [Fimbriimonadales bacterium]